VGKLENKLKVLEDKLNEQQMSKSKHMKEFKDKEDKYMSIINNFSHMQSFMVENNKDSSKEAKSVAILTEENEQLRAQLKSVEE